MKFWTAWNTNLWNERFLKHYFAPGLTSPVTSLSITSYEFARVVGVDTSEGQRVRGAFVDRIRERARIANGLVADADPSRALEPGYPPRYLSHLVFTCIAAAESTEELDEERSFHKQLKKLLGEDAYAADLRHLPTMWRSVAAWLDASNGKYRRLQLPAPGGLTQIGYTVRLTIPDRRDARELSRLLAVEGVTVDDPPVGVAVGLVRRHRDRFRDSFRAVFDDFERRFEARGQSDGATLLEHPFWDIVREVATRGRGVDETVDVPRFQLLGIGEGDELGLFLVADREAAMPREYVSRELNVPYGPWRSYIARGGGEALEREQMNVAVREFLDGNLRLSGLSSLVDQGILLFAEGEHCLLEVAPYARAEDVRCVFAREAVASAYLARVGTAAVTFESSAFDGWVWITPYGFRRWPSEELADSPLARCWMLHEMLLPRLSRLVDGIRVDDGWLGDTDLAPRVLAPGAEGVRIDGRPCTRADDDRMWHLPPEDREGPAVVETSYASGLHLRKETRFYRLPASDGYKRPKDLAPWLCEGLGGTVPLGSEDEVASSPNGATTVSCEQSILLGRGIGEFVDATQDAVWKILLLGDAVLATRAATNVQMVPETRSPSARLRRRWRKLLYESASDPMDAQIADGIHASRQVRDSHLPATASIHAEPRVVPPPGPVAPEVTRLVRAFAAMCVSRADISTQEWRTLLLRMLPRLAYEQCDLVTRAWQEAGLLDVAAFAQWSSRRVFARRPRFIAATVGNTVHAMLSGLCLPPTMALVRTEASRPRAGRQAVFVVEKRSVCSFVPATLVLRAAGRADLEDLARRLGLPIVWPDLSTAGLLRTVVKPRLGPPPHGYRIAGETRIGEVDVVRHVREGCPSIWAATTQTSGCWSYDENTTRLWACALANLDAVRSRDDGIIERAYAYFPLPIARLIAAFGVALPGPHSSRTNHYYYPVVPSAFRELILDVLTQVFDPTNCNTAPSRPTKE